MRGSNTILIVLAIVLFLTAVCCLTLACVGGILIFASSSASSFDPSSPKPVERANVSDFCAEYQVTDPERTYDEYHATITFDCDRTMSFVEYADGEQATGQGTWSFEQSNLTFSFETDAGARFSGTTRGNINNFTIDGQWSNGAQGEIKLTR